jgi:hypothetical protein
VAANGKNGSDAYKLQALEATFRDCGFTFRHCPKSKIAFMRWQAGRSSYTEFQSVDGGIYIEEAFQLIAFAETANELVDRLAAH